MAGRRELSFGRLEEALPDVDRLLAGHKTVGNWSLGQICNHLSGAIRCSMDGFTVQAPWLIRKTIAPIVLRSMFKTGKVREGMKVPESFLPRPGLDAGAEAESLRAEVARFASFKGTFADHPFFGALTPEQWSRLHCIHCAHHLSFALPGASA